MSATSMLGGWRDRSIAGMVPEASREGAGRENRAAQGRSPSGDANVLKTYVSETRGRGRRDATVCSGLFRGDVRVGLDAVRHDHEEVFASPRREGDDALGLVLLIGGPQLDGVVIEQVLDVEDALVVELGELHLGALAQTALDRVPVGVPCRV